MNKEVITQEIIDGITNKSVMNKLIDVVFVHDNPCTIISELTEKVNGELKTTTTTTTYVLKSHKMIVKNNLIFTDEVNTNQTIMKNTHVYDCAALRINREFITNIDSYSVAIKPQPMGFSLNPFSGLFSKPSTKDLINKILDFSAGQDWVLLNDDTYKLFSNTPYFESVPVSGNNLLSGVGILKMSGRSVAVFLNPNITKRKRSYISKTTNTNKIYTGKNTSVCIMIKDKFDISMLSENGYMISIEYKIVKNDDIKCIII